jgi:hypothetical protein
MYSAAFVLGIRPNSLQISGCFDSRTGLDEGKRRYLPCQELNPDHHPPSLSQIPTLTYFIHKSNE